jgi:ribosome biogenesis protein Nip4
MSELNDFRILNDFESSIISRTLNKICNNSENFTEDYKDQLYISFDRNAPKGLHPLVFLLSKRQPELIEKFQKDIKIIAAGLYFGFFEKDKFNISLEGTEYLTNLFKCHILVIDTIGEKSVLYGNYIRIENVLKFPPNLIKDDMLIVKNRIGEICAIGKSLINTHDLTRLKNTEKSALNLVDKGYYLRKKQ